MDETKLDVIMGFAQIAAAAAICNYGLNLRGMLPGKEKDEQVKNLNNMADFYKELESAITEKEGE